MSLVRVLVPEGNQINYRPLNEFPSFLPDRGSILYKYSECVYRQEKKKNKTKQNMMKTLFLKRNLYLGSKSFTVLVLCGFARVAQCAGITEIGNDE